MDVNRFLKKFPLPAAWRIYPVVLLVTVLIVLVIGHGFYTSTRITNLYSPLIDAAMEIKLEATFGHLWLEEILSGDRDAELKTVYAHYDKADWYAKAMLNGGQNEEGLFLPLKDPVLRKEIAETHRQLQRFVEITKERVANHRENQAGSGIDRQYDHVFANFIRQADKVETLLQNRVQHELVRFKAVQMFLVVFSIVFAILSFFFFRKIEKNDRLRRLAIQQMNVQLQREIVERLEAEKALHRSQELYRLAQRVAKVGSWELTVATGELIWSDEVEPMFGMQPGEFAGTYEAFLECVHPEDRPLIVELVAVAMENDIPYEVEHRILWPDQTERWLQEIGLAFRDREGRLVRMVGMVRDVTARKKAQQERESLIVELREALDNVKTLSGFLPICASCKRIRDDKGYWNQIEAYIRDHSEAQFSHGICPECVKKLYPFLSLDEEGKVVESIPKSP
ncbi:PAS domain-containing protein [Thiovibrio sp. JS02]